MSAYLAFMLLAIGVSAGLWIRTYRKDRSLFLIYISGLLVAFFGAKVAYLLAEGWLHTGKEDFWLQIATGKSVLGALLGGYLGVEMAKRFLGKTVITGDFFVSVVPFAIAMGRVGCSVHGCCQGKPLDDAMHPLTEVLRRWPAAQVELIFNLVMLCLFAAWRKQGRFAGQHFHLYLISYGLFRFAHEFLRATPSFGPGFSGYQLIALAMACFGIWAYRKRSRLARDLRAIHPAQVSVEAGA